MQMPYGTKHSTNVKIRKKPARDDMSCWTSVRMSALAHFSPCDSHMLFTFWLASKTDTQTKSRTRSKDRQKSLISSQCCEAWNHSCPLVLDEVYIHWHLERGFLGNYDGKWVSVHCSIAWFITTVAGTCVCVLIKLWKNALKKVKSKEHAETWIQTIVAVCCNTSLPRKDSWQTRTERANILPHVPTKVYHGWSEQEMIFSDIIRKTI